MKEYCRYNVIDLESCQSLVIGKKYKDFSGMTVNCIFRTFIFFGRKIREYYKLKTVCGRTCVIVYWTGEKDKHDIGSVVTSNGIGMRLRGLRYTNDSLNMKFYIWALGLLSYQTK